MNRQVHSDKELVEAIAALPRSLPPGRDLWPQIEQRLEDHVSEGGYQAPGLRWRFPAAAAALVVAFAAGILLGRQLQDGLPSDGQGPLPASRALIAATQASEREYQAAFRQFTPIDSAHVALGPQTVQSIEGSWQELQQAETALLSALEEYPENAYLNQRLLDLRARQLQFLKQIVTLDPFSRRKT
jgi:hypothetical protein